MKLIKEVEIYQAEVMDDPRYNGLTVLGLWYNPNATKHRYVLTRSEMTQGFSGSIESKEGTFRKKKDAVEAFNLV